MKRFVSLIGMAFMCALLASDARAQGECHRIEDLRVDYADVLERTKGSISPPLVGAEAVQFAQYWMDQIPVAKIDLSVVGSIVILDNIQGPETMTAFIFGKDGCYRGHGMMDDDDLRAILLRFGTPT